MYCKLPLAIVISRISTPHILISDYDNTDKRISNDVHNDQHGENCCYGNTCRLGDCLHSYGCQLTGV